MALGHTQEYRTVFRQHLLSVLLLWLSALLVACDASTDTELVDLEDQVSDEELVQFAVSPPKGTDYKTLCFGFDLRASPLEDSRQYLPFLNYLQASTGYTFELRFTPKGSSIIDDLGSGKVHFAAIGAVSYIQGNKKHGLISLARGLNRQNKAVYKSMIVVHPDSSIKTMADLKARRFTFGSVDSTQGHLIPRIILGENGITLDDLSSYEYTGSHLNCANAVVSRKSDACGMQDTMARTMQQQGLVRILHESDYFPSSGIVVNPNVPPEIIARVKQALINFEPTGKHKNGLYHWAMTEMPNGFTSSSDEDYQELRKWLINLGLIES